MERGSELDKNAEIAAADQNGRREGRARPQPRTDPDKHREKLIFQQQPITSHGTRASNEGLRRFHNHREGKDHQG